MKYFTFLFLMLTFYSCKDKYDYTSFENFSHRFKPIQVPINFNDHYVFKEWSKNDLIDSASVDKYELIESHVDKNLPIKNLREYQCSYIGRFGTKTYDVLLHKMKTGDTIGGKPKIILSTYSKDGKKKDEIIGLWSDDGNAEYTNATILKIVDSSKVEIKSIHRYSELKNDQMVPGKIVLNMIKYDIQKDGKIIKIQEFSQPVYKEDNQE